MEMTENRWRHGKFHDGRTTASMKKKKRQKQQVC